MEASAVEEFGLDVPSCPHLRTRFVLHAFQKSLVVPQTFPTLLLTRGLHNLTSIAAPR